MIVFFVIYGYLLFVLLANISIYIDPFKDILFRYKWQNLNAPAQGISIDFAINYRCVFLQTMSLLNYS